MSDEYLDEITEARRQSLAETIHPIGADAVKALAETLFPQVDHPWRERLLNFVAENSTATFHHGSTHDRVHIIYCDAKDKGFWFLPGSGSGPLQAKGLKIMKELVAAL